VGVEYACMLATLGVKITLIEGRNEVLGFLDHEITEAFQYQMRRMGITLRLGEKVAAIEQIKHEGNGNGGNGNGNGNGHGGAHVRAILESGKTLQAASLLYAVGRQG